MSKLSDQEVQEILKQSKRVCWSTTCLYCPDDPGINTSRTSVVVNDKCYDLSISRGVTTISYEGEVLWTSNSTEDQICPV